MFRIDDKFLVEIDYNVNPNVHDILRIIKIQNDFINGNYNELIINFTDVTFINAAVLVIIGTLPVYANELGKTVRFNFQEGEKNSIFKFMKKVGLYEYFTKNSNSLTTDNAIPFNKISDEDMMENYTDRIMRLAPINIVQEAKDILSSYFYEIYQNAFYHAQSPIDVFSCGHWMPTKKELIFSIYDMGIGIPQSIKNHIDEKMSSRQCIEWAFTEGKSTIEDKLVKRGLGLSRLEKFIKLNKGSLSLYTEDICCIINEQGKEFVELANPIKGTLVIINICADTQHIYIVK